MNRTTKTIVSIMGIMVGIGGIDHGFFETLQGNTPTNGLFIQAIGEANRMWVHGSEDAFTLIPNFLATGILAIMVSLLIMVWSVKYVGQKNGSTIFLLLCVLLFLVGGGVGQIAFFLPVWAVSTRINKPLTWWRKVLPEKYRQKWGRWWAVFLGSGLALFFFALEIAIFGFVPGMSDPDQKLYFCWWLLLAALLSFFLSFVAGFSKDIQDSRLEQA